MLGIGGVCGSWISYGCYVGLTNDGQWRIPFVIQIVPAAILGLLILLFPESPKWLIAKGKHELVSDPCYTWLLGHDWYFILIGHLKVSKTLARLHSKGDESNPWVLAEYEQIQEQITFDRENEAYSYKELLKNYPIFVVLYSLVPIRQLLK
jgi:MFS family permease